MKTPCFTGLAGDPQRIGGSSASVLQFACTKLRRSSARACADTRRAPLSSVASEPKRTQQTPVRGRSDCEYRTKRVLYASRACVRAREAGACVRACVREASACVREASACVREA
eukprot:1432330-Pleurochrysis_carterae.AAC.1